MAVGTEFAPCTVYFRLDEQDAVLPETRPDGLIINARDSELQTQPDELEVHKAKLEEAKNRQQVTDDSVSELLEKLKQLPGVSSRKLADLQASHGTSPAVHGPRALGEASPESRCAQQQVEHSKGVNRAWHARESEQVSSHPDFPLPGSAQKEASPGRRFQKAVRQVVQGNRRSSAARAEDGRCHAPCFAAVVAAAVAARNAQEAACQVFHTPREKIAEPEDDKLRSGTKQVSTVTLEFHTPRGCTPVTTPRGNTSLGSAEIVETPDAPHSAPLSAPLSTPLSTPRSASPSVSRAASPEWTQRLADSRSLSPRMQRASSLSGSPANGSLLVRARQAPGGEQPEEAWHGWTLQSTPGGRFFHHHAASGTSLWETPPELVPVLGEWREVGDPGAMYWYNDKLGTSCWKDPRNCFSIHEAALDGNMAYLRLYAMAKGFVDAVNLKGRSALHNAAAAGQAEVVAHLLHEKADVSLPDQGLSTPLHWACRYGHETAVQLLLQAGANVDGGNMLGDTPLHEAAGLGQITILPTLMAANANPLARNAEQRTAAEVAGVRGWAEARILLMEYEQTWADPDDPVEDCQRIGRVAGLGGGLEPVSPALKVVRAARPVLRGVQWLANRVLGERLANLGYRGESPWPGDVDEDEDSETESEDEMNTWQWPEERMRAPALNWPRGGLAV